MAEGDRYYDSYGEYESWEELCEARAIRQADAHTQALTPEEQDQYAADRAWLRTQTDKQLKEGKQLQAKLLHKYREQKEAEEANREFNKANPFYFVNLRMEHDNYAAPQVNAPAATPRPFPLVYILVMLACAAAVLACAAVGLGFVNWATQ